MEKPNWDPFIRDHEDQKLMDFAGILADEFAERAAKHDHEGTFAYENIDRLKEAGYLKLTVPQEYGGDGISLYQLLLAQERLAAGDASTALAVGWHMGMVFSLSVTRAWPANFFAEFCQGVVECGHTLNSCASEPATGSPSRGGRPQTTAVKQADASWVINGRKTWSTLSPALSWFLVTAAIEGEEGVGEFLIKRESAGLRIVETWNSMGMRATGSHDLILENVHVPGDALMDVLLPGKKSARKADASGWMLHIPACYLGIAMAARLFAVQFALTYRPNSLQGPIADVPHIQDQIGRMELELFTARSLMYSVAERWDRYHREQKSLQLLAGELAAAKTFATNTAISVVDRAMRVVGGSSLFRSLPLERFYRDVRAGLHNPPMDDATYRMLAAQALMQFKQG